MMVVADFVQSNVDLTFAQPLESKERRDSCLENDCEPARRRLELELYRRPGYYSVAVR